MELNSQEEEYAEKWIDQFDNMEFPLDQIPNKLDVFLSHFDNIPHIPHDELLCTILSGLLSGIVREPTLTKLMEQYTIFARAIIRLKQLEAKHN